MTVQSRAIAFALVSSVVVAFATGSPAQELPRTLAQQSQSLGGAPPAAGTAQPQPRPAQAPAGQAQPAPAGQRPAATAPPAPPPLRAYRRDDLATLSQRFEQSRANARVTDQRPIPDVRRDADAAIQRGDFRAAARFWEVIALRSGTDSAPWVRYSQALTGVRTEDWRERQTINDEVLGAGYLAYRRAANRNEEAFALAHLRQVFAGRQQWRAAIDVARATFEARDTPEAREAYQRLRDQHGFRYREASVESDAASPRVCFQFTEALRKGRVDFAPFIRQEGVAAPPITVEERRICVDGLRHGENYAFQLREGLPSDIGENLVRNVDLRIYVPDRRPQVRFTGRAYVLPRTGQKGVPIVTVNAASVDVAVHRIGDRSIGLTLGADFPRPLETYELRQLLDERAIPVWQGTLATENRLNAEVTTAFPMDEAARTLEPGVYVMTAKPTVPGRRNPDADDDVLAAQWFIVSDLGLTAFSGVDGVHGFVHALGSAKPMADVEMRLVARNNEVLATRRTDDKGHVRFERGLARGEGALQPALLIATARDGDYAFLNLRQPAFDLSDRGVAGREVTQPLDAFLAPERGVYRPGETVHLTTLLRDGKGDAVANLPLTLIVKRPDGVEYRRIVTQDQGAGGRTTAIPILSTAPTGSWTVQAVTDPRQPAVGEAKFLVEDFVPDRIAFDLTAGAPRLDRGQPFPATLTARYLFGVPAADMAVEGEVVATPTTSLPDHPGYRFGIADDEEGGDREALPEGLRTDAQGRAAFSAPLPKVEETSRPVEAKLNVRIAEPGGRAVERSVTAVVLPGTPLIGVKPLFEGDRVGEDETAAFEVIALGPDGRTRQTRPLAWRLLRLETRWQWTRGVGGWESEAIVTTRRIADGRIETPANAPARIAAVAPWGKYRLEVEDSGSGGAATHVEFEAGYGAGGSADTPDVLETSLDKPGYAAGETMQVSINARFAGTASVMILSDRLVHEQTAEVAAGRSRIAVPVVRDIGAGAYVVVILRRPLDVAAGRMPGRAIGLAWFTVDAGARKLAVALEAPERISPRTTLRVPVRLQGLSPGESARVTIAAVDLGILTLTNHQPPKPDEFYLGQRRLSAEIRDLYGQLLDGMSAARGAIRSGGDGGGARFSGAPPAQEPLSLFSGLLTPDPDGRAEAVFDIPDFNGTVRLMAMAWTPTKLGSAQRDVIARDPVVVSATLPRVMGHADRATLRLDLVNAEAPAGDYQIAVTPSGPLQLSQPTATVRLGAGGRGAVSLPLAASGVGVGSLAVKLTGPNGLDLTSTYRLGVRPAVPEVTRRTILALDPGAAVTVSRDLTADLTPGTARVSLAVGPSSAIDIPGLILSLDRYPYGCTEQITSRAMPLLYLDLLAAAEGGLGLEAPVQERIRDSIDRILSRQAGAGSFGLWTAGSGEDSWLDAFVTDFLSRARERGHAVPQAAFNQAIERLRTLVTSANGVGDNDGMDLAYAHYVLARNGRGSLADLRWIADTKLADVKTPLARGQIAASLALMGDQPRAERVYQAAVRQLTAQGQTDQARFDYGSRLRDAAALMTLGAEARLARAPLNEARRVMEDMRARTRIPSTQEKVWLVLAAQALVEDARRIALDVDGRDHQGPLNRTLTAEEVARGFGLRNRGPDPLRAVVAVTGAPREPEPAAANGFTLERVYRTLDGRPADPARVAQGTRLVVVLTVTEREPQLGQLMLVDRLPAGFEIDNPSLIASAETSGLRWLPAEPTQPDHRAFRDDRFEAAYTRPAGGPNRFQAAYMIRAVTPGRFLLPPATIEDMYRPERFARTAAGQVEVTARP